MSEDQKERYEDTPVSTGKVYRCGYGTVLQASETRREDGTIEAVYQYAPILQPDSAQLEGVGAFRALYVAQEPFPQARFRLVQCVASTDASGLKLNSFREVGMYFINLPRGQVDYSIKLRRSGETVDLIAQYPTSRELAFHNVPIAEGTPLTLPSTSTFRPPQPTPTFPNQQRRETEGKELLARQQTLEELANDLVTEAKTRVAMKRIDAVSEEIILEQIRNLENELEPVSMVTQPISVRYVNQLNQARALIHDMQTVNPPLFDRTMAREWQSKLGA